MIDITKEADALCRTYSLRLRLLNVEPLFVLCSNDKFPWVRKFEVMIMSELSEDRVIIIGSEAAGAKKMAPQPFAFLYEKAIRAHDGKSWKEIDYIKSLMCYPWSAVPDEIALIIRMALMGTV